MNDWIKWAGGERPVPPRDVVETLYRGPEDPALGVRWGWPHPCPAWRLDWSHDGSDDDIVYYRVVAPAVLQ